MHRLRSGGGEDRSFVVEMARLACTLEDRPLPSADAPEVFACLPASPAAATIAIDSTDRGLGAAWWHLHEPSMLAMPDGSPIPELTMAVAAGVRGHGIGAALIEAVVIDAAAQFEVLALNVHLRNPAARLYMRARFRVAGKGRGWFGVAMTRDLRA
jgi:GNAT superfamily N-acetyltransferase